MPHGPECAKRVSGMVSSGCSTPHLKSTVPTQSKGAEHVAQREHGGLWGGYASEPRPLKSYSTLLAIFNGLFAGMLLLARRRSRAIPERITPADLLSFGGATYRLGRLIAKDTVTSPLRAPFTEFQGAGDAPGEVSETPRGTGFRHAIGELVT